MFFSRFHVQLIRVPSGSIEVLFNAMVWFTVWGKAERMVKEAVGGTFRTVMCCVMVCVASMSSVTVRRIV